MSGKPPKCELCESIDSLYNTRCADGIWRWICPFCINDQKDLEAS